MTLTAPLLRTLVIAHAGCPARVPRVVAMQTSLPPSAELVTGAAGGSFP